MGKWQRFLPAVAACLVATAGFVSLAQVLSFHVHGRRFGRIDDSLLPFTPAQDSRLLVLGIGVLLLYLSLQIFRRKRMAYILVSAGLAALIGAELTYFKNLSQLVFYCLALAVLLGTEKYFTVRNDNLSLKRGAAAAAGIIAIVFVYGTIGFMQLGRHEIGTRLGIPGAAKYAAQEIFTFQESPLPLASRHARWFVASLNTASVVAYGLAAVSLFRPLRFQYGVGARDRGRARRIIEDHGESTEDFFKLWPPDKHYFFSEASDSLLAYKVVGSDALVLEGPVGAAAGFPKVIREFAEFAHRSGWSVTYAGASEGFQRYIRHGDYQRLFIGNEAAIDTRQFAARTSHSKHFRYVRNRAERDGLSFEYWVAPLTAGQIATLDKISGAWLGTAGRREYTFALGYFDAGYIGRCDAAVLMQNGQAVAYANVLPRSHAPGRTIDHMRYTGNMAPTGMHYLLLQLILHLHGAGVREFNLGLAPLSGLEGREKASVPERLLAALKKLGSHYYSFGGLEQFKNKFEPHWQPRYIYYQGSPAALIRLARSLTKAVSLPVAGRGRRWAITALSTVAALCYTSFPLAYLLDPAKAVHGFASDLGATGASYASVFDGLDIISSLLMLTAVGLIWAKLRPETRLPRLALALLALGVLGALLAAVTPLPVHAANVGQKGLHDFFSAINFVGIGAAACCLALYTRSKRLWLLFGIFTATLLLTAFLGNNLAASIMQRVLIVLVSVWMVIICVRLSQLDKVSKYLKSQGFLCPGFLLFVSRLG